MGIQDCPDVSARFVHLRIRVWLWLILLAVAIWPVAALGQGTQSAGQAGQASLDSLTGAIATPTDETSGFAAVRALYPSVKEALAPGAMVVAAHPLATKAGLAILEQGGSAADAAVAIQAVLTLVEPQSSGFGGGAFALHWSAGTLMLDSYDGRETAPIAAGGGLFLDAHGRPMGFREAVIGGRAVGVPGTLRLLERMHGDHGKLAWGDLLQPALDLARRGFAVSPRLHQSLVVSAETLADDPVAASYFLDDTGRPWPIGHRLQNSDYAALLETLMAEGVDAFYTGPIADDLEDKVQGHGTNPGLLSSDDLSRYQAIRRAPVCVPYQQFRVCGMGPPSSGGLTVGQILMMLDQFEIGGRQDDDTRRRYHLYVEVAKRAFADRALYMADADFVSVPSDALLDADYLADRAGEINPNTATIGPARAGSWPAETLGQTQAADPKQQDSGTTHFVVVDHDGNVISYTGSIESAFGSRQMVHGILLNNQLTDFSFRATADDGTLIANRVQPGKRPRSSMAPTIVFDGTDRPILAVGSPGGSRIINYVAMAVVNMLGLGLSPGEAFAAPHLGSRNGPVEAELGAVDPMMIEGLRAAGHEVRLQPMVSGLHGVFITSGQLLGGADPRREGHVEGLP